MKRLQRRERELERAATVWESSENGAILFDSKLPFEIIHVISGNKNLNTKERM